MPGNPKECRENAKHCLQLAFAARTQVGRERFEGLAQRWMALANDYEAANFLLANWRFPTAQDGSSDARGCACNVTITNGKSVRNRTKKNRNADDAELVLAPDVAPPGEGTAQG